jgi:hypothetical protein
LRSWERERRGKVATRVRDRVAWFVVLDFWIASVLN